MAPVLRLGRGWHARAQVIAPLGPAAAALSGTYVRNGAGLLFGCRAGDPVIQIICGIRETFAVSCWRDARGRTLYLDHVVESHLERFGLPRDVAQQEAWAQACVELVVEHEAGVALQAWKRRRSDAYRSE